MSQEEDNMDASFFLIKLCHTLKNLKIFKENIDVQGFDISSFLLYENLKKYYIKQGKL